LAMGFLRNLAGINIHFLKWMSVGLPAAILILPLAWLILLKIFPPEVRQLSISKAQMGKDFQALGGLNPTEKKTLLIFSLAVFLWLFDPILNHFIGVSIPIEVVALMTSILFFLPGIEVMSWKEAEHVIDWGSIVLIATGLSLGEGMFETGAARWLAWVSLSNIGLLSVTLRIFLVVLVVEVLKIAFSSNTVTGLIVIPIVIAFSLEFGFEPWLVAGPAAIATSLAFILVTSSPTNVIPYSSGYFTIKDFALAGSFMTLLSAVCVTIAFVLFGQVL